MGAEEYEYIVVGSGAGGGPLAANLAKTGARVLLIEAGSEYETSRYQVPCFHAFASEERGMSWDYFVHHYSNAEDRDWRYRAEKGGVFYPRAGTLGGCTAHNAMITIVPHDSDWDRIAKMTGDQSWRADRMHPYFEKVREWLQVNTVDLRIGLEDPQIVQTMIDAAFRGGFIGVLARILSGRKLQFNPNEPSNVGAEGMTSKIPLATTAKGRRNGTREYIQRVRETHGDTFTVQTNTLVTRVIFDRANRAVGVECLEAPHLYGADPESETTSASVPREFRCTRDVILAGGAFNTPQLLMLSGIGPKDHLDAMKIPCRLDRQGVGANLQDRYEVSVVSTRKKDFAVLNGATFKPPNEGEAGDPCYQQWKLEGKGMYTSNGAVAAVISKSAKAHKRAPDLFIFGLPGKFRAIPKTRSGQKTPSPGPSSKRTRTTQTGLCGSGRTIRSRRRT
jgi:choline dehydrogenase